MKWLLALIVFSTNSYAQDIIVFAHRGFRGLNPENTLTAFKEALHHTSTVEMDIMISKNMDVVVTHDAVINSKIYTDKQGKALSKDNKNIIYELNTNELSDYTLGILPNSAFPEQSKLKETIPTLENVMQELTKYSQSKGLSRPHYFIETKISENTDDQYHPKPKEVVELLVKVLKKYIKPDEVIIQSFDSRTLSYIKKYYPEYKTCLLDKKKQPLSKYLTELDFKPDYFSPSFKEITPQTLKESKQFAVPLVGGNSNSKKEVEQMQKWGIQYVISDYPYKMLKN